MTASDLLAAASAQQPKTRQRTRKPAWSFTGLDLEHWRADPERVRWAQTDTMFKDTLTVLINEQRRSTLTDEPGHTENYHLGVARGYEQALGVLRAMTGGVTPQTAPIGDPEYSNE